MTLFNVTYEVRKVGAISIFYPKHVSVDAENEADAWSKGFDLLHEMGYETRGRGEIHVIEEGRSREQSEPA